MNLVRAFENLCFWVGCDVVAKNTASLSVICSPLRVLKKIEKKEGMIVADVDLNKLNTLKKYYRF